MKKYFLAFFICFLFIGVAESEAQKKKAGDTARIAGAISATITTTDVSYQTYGQTLDKNWQLDYTLFYNGLATVL